MEAEHSEKTDQETAIGTTGKSERILLAEEEAGGSSVIHLQALHNTKVHSDGWPITPSPPSKKELIQEASR